MYVLIEIKAIFASLTEDQQSVCYGFAVSEWQSGHSDNYFGAIVNMFDTSIEVIESLINRGIVAKVSTHKIARDWIDTNKEQYEEIQNKITIANRDNTSWHVNAEESSLVSNYDNRELVLNMESSYRYRLFSEEFHNYVFAH